MAGNWASTNHKGFLELTVVDKVLDQFRLFHRNTLEAHGRISDPMKRVGTRWECARMFLRKNDTHIWGDVHNLKRKLEGLFLLRAALDWDADALAYKDLVPDSVPLTDSRVDLSWCGATSLDLEAFAGCVHNNFTLKMMDLRGWMSFEWSERDCEMALRALEVLCERFPSLDTIMVDPPLIMFAENHSWSLCNFIKDRHQDGNRYDGCQISDKQRCPADVYEWVFNILSHSKTPWMFRACEHEPDRAEEDVDGELVLHLAAKIDNMPYNSDWWTLQHHICLLLKRLACPEWRQLQEGVAAGSSRPMVVPKKEMLAWLDANFYYAGTPPRTHAAAMVREAIGRGVSMRMIQRILHAWCEHYVVTLVKRHIDSLYGLSCRNASGPVAFADELYPCKAGVALQPDLALISFFGAQRQAYLLLLYQEYLPMQPALPWEDELVRAQQQQNATDSRSNKKKGKAKKRVEKQCAGLTVGRDQAEGWYLARDRAKRSYEESHIWLAPVSVVMKVWWRYAGFHTVSPLRYVPFGARPTVPAVTAGKAKAAAAPAPAPPVSAKDVANVTAGMSAFAAEAVKRAIANGITPTQAVEIVREEMGTLPAEVGVAATRAAKECSDFDSDADDAPAAPAAPAAEAEALAASSSAEPAFKNPVPYAEASKEEQARRDAEVDAYHESSKKADPVGYEQARRDAEAEAIAALRDAAAKRELEAWQKADAAAYELVLEEEKQKEAAAEAAAAAELAAALRPTVGKQGRLRRGRK